MFYKFSVMVQLGNYKGSTVIVKKSLLYASGLLGLAFYCSGSIFLDRGNPEKAKQSLNEARDTVVRDKVFINLQIIEWSSDTIVKWAHKTKRLCRKTYL